MENEILFDAVLTPNRSLTKKSFLIVMAAASFFCFTIGLIFFLAGAWPVTGFLGLELLLLYLSFRISYRSANRRETVQLRRTSLSVSRFLQNGKSLVWSFQPYWLQIECNFEAKHDRSIVLRSKGTTVGIGSFLSPKERADFAEALIKALHKCKA